MTDAHARAREHEEARPDHMVVEMTDKHDAPVLVCLHDSCSWHAYVFSARDPRPFKSYRGPEGAPEPVEPPEPDDGLSGACLCHDLQACPDAITTEGDTEP